MKIGQGSEREMAIGLFEENRAEVPFIPERHIHAPMPDGDCNRQSGRKREQFKGETYRAWLHFSEPAAINFGPLIIGGPNSRRDANEDSGEEREKAKLQELQSYNSYMVTWQARPGNLELRTENGLFPRGD